MSCAGATDCGHGQVCTAERFCAAPGMACSPVDAATVDTTISDGPVDARRVTDAAPVHDGPPPPPHDAAADVALQIHIDDQGTVTLAGGGSCDSGGPQNGDCLLPAPVGVPAVLEAVPYPNRVFEQWTTPACAGQGATCTFTPLAPTMVGVKFHKQMGD